MQRKRLADMPCPIARGLDRIGEWWSLLILRDALLGLSHFDEFQRSLGIAPNILARRLRALVAAGLLEKRRYSARPVRYAYIPTACGRDLRPVLLTLLAWGNAHFAPEGASIELVDTVSGAPVTPLLVDAVTRAPITAPAYALAAGPAADAATRAHLTARGARPFDEPPQPT